MGVLPLQLPWWGELQGYRWSGCVYSWNFQDESSKEMASSVKRLNLVATYSGRRRNSFSRSKKRTCEALTVIYLLALETFLLEYEC